MKAVTPRRWAALLALGGLLLGACRDGKAPSDPGEGTPPAAAGAGETGLLTALRPPLSIRVREQAPEQALAKGDSLELRPGAVILSGEGGHGHALWPEFLDLDLASGADLLVSQVFREGSQAVMDQAAGTVRYRLLGEDLPLQVRIQTNDWAFIELKKAPTDVIVSLQTEPLPLIWVAVVKGNAWLQRGEDRLRLKAGQAAAVAADGALPAVADLDREALNDWYDDYASGKVADVGPADHLFRCVAPEGGAVLGTQPGGTDGAAIEAGERLAVLERDATGDWLLVRGAEDAQGWLSTVGLVCNAPLDKVSIDEGSGAAATAATATTPPVLRPSPSPRLSPVPTRTLAPLLTPSPTASATLAAAVVNLSADKTELTAGECTQLRWTVTGVRSYSLDGAGKAGDSGSEKVCPKETTTYTLTATLPDGSEVKRTVRIKVRAAEATPGPSQAATARPSDTPRPTAGPVQSPTAISLPTDPPAPTDEPTIPATEEPTAAPTVPPVPQGG